VLECAAQSDVCLVLPAGLIGHLRAVSVPMYHLYIAMKEKSSDQITTDKIALASGKKILNLAELSGFLQKLESTHMTIQRAFEKQVNATVVSPLFS
jgi:ADP-ribose pyrophosphatase YjhB (NUDIX family)